MRREGRNQPFFHEWERRAIWPSTMARRLAPYLRYYSSKWSVENHGIPHIVIVVFEDEKALENFWRVPREEMDRADVDVPLYVSDRRFL